MSCDQAVEYCWEFADTQERWILALGALDETQPYTGPVIHGRGVDSATKCASHATCTVVVLTAAVLVLLTSPLLWVVTVALATLDVCWTVVTHWTLSRVVERYTLKPVVERVPLGNRLQVLLVFRTFIGRYVLCSIPCVRAYLVSGSIRAGEVYDSPESRKCIPAFIAGYGVEVTELEQPLHAFRTLNEFFYRRLRPGARLVEEPANARQAVCPADCRIRVFPRVDPLSDKLSVKGAGFSVRSLLGHVTFDRVFGQCSELNVCICRLAPDDYHRFHACVAGVLDTTCGELGEDLLPVKSCIISSGLDPLTRNRRKCLLLRSDIFGSVAYVPVGATHVGSIVLTASDRQQLGRADELGYFAYGGSSIVLVFGPGFVFAPDLVQNSASGRETLVRYGQSLGAVGECGRHGPGCPTGL